MMSILNESFSLLLSILAAGSTIRRNHPGVWKAIFEVGNEFAQIVIINRAINGKLDLFVGKRRQQIRLANRRMADFRDFHFIRLFEVADGIICPGIKIA